MGRELGEERLDVGHVVEHVMADDDVSWADLASDVRPTAKDSLGRCAKVVSRVLEDAQQALVGVDSCDCGRPREEGKAGGPGPTANIED